MQHPKRSFHSRLSTAGFVALLVSALAAPTVLAGYEEPESSASGSFRMADEVFELDHAIAFRTTQLNSRLGEDTLVVVLTQGPVDEKEVAAAVEDSGNWTGSGHIRLILRFEPDGKLFWGIFQGKGMNLQLETDRVTAKVDVGASRANGTVTQQRPSKVFDDEYQLESISFDVKILGASR
ncbi:MAG: hypothetical protein K8J08_17290 [Thermoanaerobaculia bacterium]|nr:hypothetical protein [Thermoanaerobaculia bacterium]